MAIQALCAPRSDCGMDGRSRVLRRERGGLLRVQGGETYHDGGFLSEPFLIILVFLTKT